MAALAGAAGSASAQDKPPCGARRPSSFNVRGFDSRSLLRRGFNYAVDEISCDCFPGRYFLFSSSSLPVTLVYKCIDDKAVSKANRDLIYCYDDMNFVHFWKLLSLRSIEAVVTVQPKIECSR
jgi:hypothetical protein